jgi:sugar lactone lactonase YvrE
MRVALSVLAVVLAVAVHVWRSCPVPHATAISLSPNVSDFLSRVPPSPQWADAMQRITGLMAPEGFAHTADGRFLFASLMTGAVVRIEVGGTWTSTVVARLGKRRRDAGCDRYSYASEEDCGRPLGITLDSRGGLLVCETYSGIYHIDREHLFASEYDPAYVPELIVGSSDVPGGAFFFNTVLEIENALYFTDSSMLYKRRDVTSCLADGRATGRLLMYRDKRVSVVAEGINFANGLLRLNNDTILVAATLSMRLLSFDIRTQKMGVFADIPCIPDNLSWLHSRPWIAVGCAARRSKMIEFTSANAWFRKVLTSFVAIPTFYDWLPKTSTVLLFDASGQPVHAWWTERPIPGLDALSEAAEVGPYLFFGSWKPYATLSYIESAKLFSGK